MKLAGKLERSADKDEDSLMNINLDALDLNEENKTAINEAILETKVKQEFMATLELITKKSEKMGNEEIESRIEKLGNIKNEIDGKTVDEIKKLTEEAKNIQQEIAEAVKAVAEKAAATTATVTTNTAARIEAEAAEAERKQKENEKVINRHLPGCCKKEEEGQKCQVPINCPLHEEKAKRLANLFKTNPEMYEENFGKFFRRIENRKPLY